MHIRILYYKGKNDATFVRTLSYSKGFIQNGATVSISFLLPPEVGWNMDFRNGIKTEDLFIGCPSILKKFRVTTYLYSISKFLKSIKKNDILFFSLPYLNSLVAAKAKRKKARFFMEFTEIPYYKIKPGVLRLFQSKSQFYAAKRADFVCVISQGLSRYYQNKGIEKIYVINMFVDFDRFTANDDNETQYDPNLISYCGTVSNSKDGVDILIKSFALTHTTHPSARLNIIGSTSHEAMKTLHDLVQDLQVEGSVSFLGRVPYKSIPILLKQSGILALARPSSCQAEYGFPTKLGEYLCSTRPVVITRTGEIDHFLTDHESCVFAMPDNAVDFSEKLNWCLDNYPSATMIGKNGYYVAKTYFSAYLETKKIINILETSTNSLS